MKSQLNEVWEQQAKYNKRVMLRQFRPSAEWMQTYILGIMSECGQLLEAMRWKTNRLQLVEEFSNNVPQELADITKYVFSMWILMGYSPEEMLSLVMEKGFLLDSLYTQEFETELKRDVVVFDLDNVLADTQTALADFFKLENFNPADLQKNIHLDLAVNQRFDEYRILKNRFETEGGYAAIEPLYPISVLFNTLHAKDFSIVVFTARPVDTFKRIRNDTFSWFNDQGVKPDMLKFGREERISWIACLLSSGHRVVLVEDDPSLVRRAKINGIQVIVPNRGYNQEVANFSSSNYGELVNRIMEEINGQSAE